MNSRQPLASSLDAYSTAARATLKLKSPAKRLSEMALLTAAASSALALAPAAEASIIYSGIRNVTAQLDSARLNTSASAIAHIARSAYGSVGIELYAERNANYLTSRGGYRSAGSQALIRGPEMISPPGSVVSSREFGPAAPNSSNTYFIMWYQLRSSQGCPVSQSCYSTDRQSDSPASGTFRSGYLGMRFPDKDSHVPNYGWLHFQIDATDKGWFKDLTLVDWAYESVPGKAILVGDKGHPVPEPSGLALMALGAAGIAALRRRRERRAPRHD